MKVNKLAGFVSLSTFLLLLSLSSQPAFANFYRYKNAEGKTINVDTLPPEAATFGYEVISPKGRVIKKVPRDKTKEEIEEEIKSKSNEEDEKQKAEIEAQKKADEQAEQQKRDDILIKSFESETDITSSRDTKLEAIKSQISFTLNNSERLKLKVEEFKKTRESYTSQNKMVPDYVNKSITDLEKQISNNDDYLKERKEQVNIITKTYDGYLIRFKAIENQKTASNADKPATQPGSEANPEEMMPKPEKTTPKPVETKHEPKKP